MWICLNFHFMKNKVGLNPKRVFINVMVIFFRLVLLAVAGDWSLPFLFYFFIIYLH